MSNARKTLFGASTMMGVSMLRVAVQASILPIIGRLLGPQAYGLIALVTPFLMFAMLMAESGLGACIVRAPAISAALEGTIFTFSTALSLAVIGVFALIAYPLGAVLQEPGFAPLLLGMSGILLLACMNIVPGSLLLRHKQYDWIALSDIVSCAGSLAGVGIGLSLDWGIWSLVAQQFGLWIGKVAVVTIGAKWRPRIGFDWVLFKSLFRFGSDLTVSGILNFICRNIDNVLIGAILGAKALGYYALAFQVATLPQMVIASSAYLTIFSYVSEKHRLGADAAPYFLRMFKGVCLITAPVVIGLAVTADQSLPLIMGEDWLPAARILLLLAPYGICQMAGGALSGYIIGLGRTDIALKLTVFSSIGTIAAIILGVPFGSDVVASSISILAVIGLMLALVAMNRAENLSLAGSTRAMLPSIVAATGMGTGVYAYAKLAPFANPVLMLVSSIALGGVLYPLILLGLFRDNMRDDIRSIKAALAKKPVIA